VISNLSYRHRKSYFNTSQCLTLPIASHLIWKYPIYRFIVPDGLDENSEPLYKEIFIDVTDSPPSFEAPMTALGNVLNETTKLLSKNKSLILDFGAGKLRNTLYLLEKGFRVCAVEFEQMYNKTERAKSMYDKAKSRRNKFYKLMFPDQFLAYESQFDLVLLINVCSIMPVPAERMLVIQYCREKLKEGGYILWYTQHRDNDYVKRCVPEVRVGDGYYLNDNNRYQTFYRDFEAYEIDGMFLANGFRRQEKFTVPHVHARLYRKIGSNPTQPVLDAEKIRRYVSGDVELEEKKQVGVRTVKKSEISETNIPNPDMLKDETTYIEALRNLQTGKASEYHNLMAAILIKLFMPPLKYYDIESEIDEGRKRIDLVMWGAESGFFNRLITQHEIHAPYIMIECKNYKIEVRNEELDQLAGRLDEKRGKFGILAYRKAEDEGLLLERCQDKLKDSKYIITLNDEDIISLLNCKLAEEEIDELMEEKMRQLIF
jgi:SAM-dependent methyltransferase